MSVKKFKAIEAAINSLETPFQKDSSLRMSLTNSLCRKLSYWEIEYLHTLIRSRDWKEKPAMKE
jgi:hypothetical protein